jgi:hypothetical protein
MDDLPATKADVNELKQVIKQLNERAWEKWVIPLLVALITGGFAVYTTWIQNRTTAQINNSQATITRYIEEDKTTGMAVAQEKVDFYKTAKSLLVDIDSSFQQVCLFSSTDPDALTNALEKYRNLTDTAPEGLDGQIISKMKKYSELVADSWLVIDSNPKIDNAKKKEFYEKSLPVLREAQDAVRSIVRKTSVNSTAN